MPDWINGNPVYFVTICCEERVRNTLAITEVASSIIESVIFRQRMKQWDIYHFLLMPDHLHALISIGNEHNLKKVVSDWKRYCAKQFGIKWQRDFFDHRIRSDNSFTEKLDYIVNNPVCKKLVEHIEDWPYSWGFEHFHRNEI